MKTEFVNLVWSQDNPNTGKPNGEKMMLGMAKVLVDDSNKRPRIIPGSMVVLSSEFSEAFFYKGEIDLNLADEVVPVGILAAAHDCEY